MIPPLQRRQNPSVDGVDGEVQIHHETHAIEYDEEEKGVRTVEEVVHHTLIDHQRRDDDERQAVEPKYQLKDVLEMYLPPSFFLVFDLDAIRPFADSASVKILFLDAVLLRSSQPSLETSGMTKSRGAAAETRRYQGRIVGGIQTNAAKRAAR